ncbi:MAG: hypothetical protein PHF18_14160 [Methanosarcina sp.]|uniref:hypothetical protein n=1 Tax=Methanosarcina sp. TaxID=2213 RepID=UPI0026348FA3|nr:hypothetical protein [Methanosarcina sp.]MDD3247971.1 hypothetical protein [Methanosarcina sp.]
MLKPITNKIQNLSKSKNRKYDLFSLMTLCIFVIMVILGVKGVPINDFVYIGFNGILVCVTVKYTIITKDILEDGKKKREIEFIQRKLEYFYYPLLRKMEKAEKEGYLTFKNLMSERNPNYNNERHNYDFFCVQYILKALKNDNIEELYKYKYLSSVPIREKFQKIEGYLGYVSLVFESDDYVESVNERDERLFDEITSFKKELESEIKIINDKLIDLIN